MSYVYSTSSASIRYETEAGPVTINGGANVSNKHLWTPRGVSTKVTKEQLEALKKVRSFNRKIEDGFFDVSAFEKDANKAARNMTKKDKGAQLEEADLAKDAAPVKKEAK